jgi:catalase (peroxidase I)
MKIIVSITALLMSLERQSICCCHAFQSTSTTPNTGTSTKLDMHRRQFGVTSVGWLTTAAGISGVTTVSSPLPAEAEVFFDPAMYGDQEMRVGTVDTVRERTRRAILQTPSLAPAFYQLALLDGLSFNAADSKYGPNGSVIYAVLNTKADGNVYLQNLQGAASVLIQAEKDLKKKTAVSIADCIAIAGAEAIESIGGPVLPVQLGRLEVDKSKVQISPLPLDILSGNRSPAEVRSAFKNAGLTEREMTALLGGLLTLEQVEKSRTTEDWKASVKPKFVERGKMGRMSDYKRLTDEDIQAALNDEYDEDPDDGWYIADSFGTRDDRFGQRIAKDQINEKNFNVILKDLLAKASTGKTTKANSDVAQFGWIGEQILDPDSPVSQSWLKKYADSNLYYTKDLGTAFNAITQLGAVYTGGKYENLLKNKPRKTLNDDDLNLF